MSDDKRPVPTGPGWWWVRTGDGDVAVLIERHVRRGLVCHHGGTGYTVPGGLNWLATVLTPAEADALRERAERAEQKRDRYREAVGRLRLVLAEAARRVRGDDGLFGAEPISETIHYALEESTDEAIQGYDVPPEPDAALVAEVAELRAEHYILAGYEPPDGARIPAGWTRADNGDWWAHESGAMEVRDWTDAGREWVAFWPEVADGLPPTAQGVAPTLFAAMRAAKEAAHALGIDTSEVKP